MAVAGKTSAVVEFDHVSLHLPLARSRERGASKKNGDKLSIGGRIMRSLRGDVIAALDDVSFTIGPGERIALLGHNGAGKTTLLRTLCGIYQPSSGKRRVRGRISALLTSTIGLDVYATGTENIRFACALYDIPTNRIDEIIDDVREFSELGHYLDMPVRTYSAGMRTRLGFSIVTSMEPEILVIDEVLSAGDMSFALKAQERILGFIGRAKVLIVASHSADLMRMFCTRAFWMDHGRLRGDGDFEEIWQAYYESRAMEAER